MDQVAMAMAKKMFFNILIFKKHLFSIFQNLVFDFSKKFFEITSRVRRQTLDGQRQMSNVRPWSFIKAQVNPQSAIRNPHSHSADGAPDGESDGWADGAGGGEPKQQQPASTIAAPSALPRAVATE